jgi:cytochrome b
MARASRRGRRPGSGQDQAPPASKLASYPVWDWPTRLSHWLIAVLFALLFAGGHYGIEPVALHVWLGYLLLVVLLFRIGWGLVGSDSARFSHMLPAPGELLAYLPRLFSRERSGHLGHNPAGALSSLALMAVLLVQSITGLFVETWGDWRGPLAERVSRDTMLLMTDLHDLLRWPLLALIAIHLLAVLAYLLFKREDRITPIFIHGRLPAAEDPGLRHKGLRRAAVVLILAILPVALVIWLGPID